MNRQGKVESENSKNPKAFIDYSQTIDDVYETLKDYNSAKEKESVNSVWWYESRYGIW